MKRTRKEIFKNANGKWTSVSAKIRNLYDSVLKEKIPRHLKESSRMNTAKRDEASSLETENTTDVTEPNRTATTETE
jgi:hypothetical protein